jgi:hypothetical protein
MPGFRRVVRCAPCGASVTEEIGFLSRCTRCGADLRTCAQCEFFDPASRFECGRPVPARISPKTAKNTCPHFTPRTAVERETTAPKTDGARKAFDDLFNF